MEPNHSRFTHEQDEIFPYAIFFIITAFDVQIVCSAARCNFGNQFRRSSNIPVQSQASLSTIQVEKSVGLRLTVRSKDIGGIIHDVHSGCSCPENASPYNDIC